MTPTNAMFELNLGYELMNSGGGGGMGADYAAYGGYTDMGFGDMGLEMGGYVMPAPHGNEMGMGVVDAMWNVDGAQHAHA